MKSLKKYLIKKLTLEQRLVLLQKLNIPKDSNNDEFIKHLLENKDYKNFCQEENSKEAKKVYQRILTYANNPEEIRRIHKDFSKNIQNKENQFPLLFMKYFIAKNLDFKIDAKKRKKIHICECCNKSFQSADYLKSHIYSVHKGMKDHTCDSCGKTFSQAGNLKRHMNAVHDGQKDHKCDSCEKAFSGAGDLKKHVNSVHNDKKDHNCDLCEKSFFRAYHLKTHINTVHNGQKNYKCNICGKSFSQSGSLNIHNKTVHGIKNKHKYV